MGTCKLVESCWGWKENALVIIRVHLIESLPKVDERSHELELAEFGPRLPAERRMTG
jgi:hypothetical protein